MLHGKSLHVEAGPPDETANWLTTALAPSPRRHILQCLAGGGKTATDLADVLGTPCSTVAAQITTLEPVGLDRTEPHPASHALRKVRVRSCRDLTTRFFGLTEAAGNSNEWTMPTRPHPAFEVAPTPSSPTWRSIRKPEAERGSAGKAFASRASTSPPATHTPARL